MRSNSSAAPRSWPRGRRKNGKSCGALSQEYAQDFPSYSAFLRHWRALQAAGQAKTDPLQQAIRLMGLPEQFTRDDLKARFHTLIGGIHPDRVGPNELAAQLIAANTLIGERKSWT